MNIVAFTEKSLFSPRLLAEELLTTQDEIARTAGWGAMRLRARTGWRRPRRRPGCARWSRW